MFKKLISLSVVFFVLLCALFLKNTADNSSSGMNDALSKILSDHFFPEKIERIEVFYGNRKEKLILLRRKGQWRLQGHIPVGGQRVLEYLSMWKNLRGELRVVEQVHLPSFDLEDQKALHVKLYYDRQNSIPDFYLLVGKKLDNRSCFVAHEDKRKKVFVVSKNLHSLSGVEENGHLSSMHWIEYQPFFRPLLKIAEIQSLEFFQGSSDFKVSIHRKGKKWELNGLGLLADSNSVEEFLEKMAKLKIAARPFAKMEASELTEKKALHLKICFTNRPNLHLLIGKKLSWNSSLIRHSGKDLIYQCNQELRTELGITSNEDPTLVYWAKSKLLSLEKGEIQAFSLQYPDKQIAFQYVNHSHCSGSCKHNHHWQRLQGNMIEGYAKNYILSEILESICFITPTGIFPSQEIYLQDKPRFVLEIKSTDSKQYKLFFSPLGIGKAVYCVLDSNPKITYKIHHWKFANIFRKGKQIFRLEKERISPKAIQKIEIKRPGTSIVWQKERKGWRLKKGKMKIEDFSNFLHLLCHLPYEDYADYKYKKNLDFTKDFSITLTLEKKKKTFLFGKASPLFHGHYVYVKDRKWIGVISDSSYRKIFR